MIAVVMAWRSPLVLTFSARLKDPQRGREAIGRRFLVDGDLGDVLGEAAWVSATGVEPAGCLRRYRCAMAASRASRSVVDGLDSSIAAGRKTARTATAQAMPRWNRPASECGQGSISRLTSRPWLDVVQVSLTGQELQTEGLAR